MGGGVGVGCHAQPPDCRRYVHRLPCRNVASVWCPMWAAAFLLARAPGRLGEYLGVTGHRMGPGDAMFAGFADTYVPESDWPALTAELLGSADVTAIARFARPAPTAALPDLLSQINAHFSGETLADILRSLQRDDSDFATSTLRQIARVSPLAASAAVEMQHRLGDTPTLRRALELEYRYTHRAQEHGDFLEGIRAAIIDKDRKPNWLHPDALAVPSVSVARMLMPLGPDTLTFTE